MIALGGWNDSKFDKYSRLVNDPVARATFTEKVIEFIEEHHSFQSGSPTTSRPNWYFIIVKRIL